MEKHICAYCGKERLESEMHQGKLIFQNSKINFFGEYQRFVDKKINWYCKDKPCFANDQMAHEG